jgi:hypothetical protein
VTRTAVAPAAGELAARAVAENDVSQILVAATLKPRAKIWPVESDERTVHRGSTHLAEIAIERLEGFAGDVAIQMDSVQPHKFRRSILGPDVIISPGRDRVMYPVFIPESCETVDAYRVLLTATAQVPDPKGRLRYLLSRMPAPDDSIALTVEGALLKIDAHPPGEPIGQGGTVSVPVTISWSAGFREPIRLELVTPASALGIGKAEVVSVFTGETEALLKIQIPDEPRLSGRYAMTVRATGLVRGEVPTIPESQPCSPLDEERMADLRSGLLPVIAEDTFELTVESSKTASGASAP